MTLDHPHGQIYAFPFLPPQLKAQWESTQQTPDLWAQILDKELQDEADGNGRIIAQTDGFIAGVPYFARYPYEVHLWARRAGVHSLSQMNAGERRELAAMIQLVVRRYENLFPDSSIDFPTLMLMQQISEQPNCENFRFHIEWLPLQRSAEKLKYRASIESGTGTFLNDSLPETQAAQLKALEPTTPQLPSIMFAD